MARAELKELRTLQMQRMGWVTNAVEDQIEVKVLETKVLNIWRRSQMTTTKCNNWIAIDIEWRNNRKQGPCTFKKLRASLYESGSDGHETVKRPSRVGE